MGKTEIKNITVDLQSYFYREDAPYFKFSCASYEVWMMLIADKGDFTFQIGEDPEQSGEVRVGEAVLCPPHIPFYRQTTKPLSFHSARFHLSATVGNGGEVAFPYTGKLAFRNTMRFMSTLSILKGLKNQNQIADQIHFVEHWVSDMLVQYISENTVDVKYESPDDPVITQAIRYIHEHMSENITMGHISRSIGLSHSQFTRKFQHEVGVAPLKYLTRLRIQKVKNMLVETGQTLEQIAEQCGFLNSFYLSRVFSQEVGVNPSQYRKLHQV